MSFMNKHAPKSVEDLVFADDDTRIRAEQYAKGKRFGNIVLHGPMGTAKSTTARIITESKIAAAGSEWDYPVHHGSTMTAADIDRLEQDWIWQTAQGIKEPFTVIEEADQLSLANQRRLRGVMDEWELGKVIMTTNHIHNLDKPLVDRCDDIKMPMANTDAWRETAAEILASEGVDITEEQLSDLLGSCNGSIRDLMRGLEDFILARK